MPHHRDDDARGSSSSSGSKADDPQSGGGSDDDDGDDDGPPPSQPGRGPPDHVRLLTLNCWGLLHISALRAPRLAEIGRRLAALDPPPHVVCLQECWVRDDFRAVRRAVRRRLPHAKFYHAGPWGAGLAILSRWPIQESSMVRYPLNGRPTAFWRGDWYVGKGVACATLRVGPDPHHLVHVFNTHVSRPPPPPLWPSPRDRVRLISQPQTHAPYEKEPHDSYVCHRTAQAWHVAKLLAAAADRGQLAVALGDFNMLPLSLAHRVITGRAPVRDVWRVLHPDSSLGPADYPPEVARNRPVPSADFNLSENGATSDGPYNTWRWTKTRQNRLRAGRECLVDPAAPDPRGKRLDYIFASTAGRWVVESASVALTHRHPDLHVSLSDHFAVQATLRRHEPSAADPGPAHYDDQLSYFHCHDTSLPLAAYDEILDMTRAYMVRERRQRRWRAIHFYASLVVWVACLVAVWFSPRNLVAFLLMLLASLTLAAGIVDGLLALLFFSSEIRSLHEFEWEVRNARRAALASSAASPEPPPHRRDESASKNPD